jgi:thermitase
MRRVGVLAGVAVVFLGVAAGASAAKPKPKTAYEPTTILVKFALPADAVRLVARLHDAVAGTTATGVTVVRIDRGETVKAKVAQYRRLPGVAYAEPNFIARADALPAPNDPSYGKQWNMSKVQAPDAWGVYPGSYASSGGMRIAIVDTGIDSTHPDLSDGRVRVDLGANCLTASGCSADPARDDNGHGTHVAGIAAAETNNGTGVAGLAYTSSLVPVKVLDSNKTGSYSAITNGIIWAVDHGARALNLSLSGTSASQTLCDAVTTAISRGAVVVAASGNDASSAAHYPAACSGAIGVGATTSSDSLASYSDTGSPNVFVSAPGDSVYSTYAGGGYTTMSGTSMATPLVTALSALLLGELPGRSVDDVKRVLATTSDKVGGGYGSDPYGICSACTWSASFGYGRINAYRALSQTGPQPDFDVTLTAVPVKAPLGGVGRATVSVGSYNGFSGTVSLSASGAPNGMMTVFAPRDVSAPGDAQLLVVASPTAPSGSYVLTVTGTSGALSHSTSFAVSVTGVSVSGVPGSVGVAAPGTPAPPDPAAPPAVPAPTVPAVSVGTADFVVVATPYQRSVARGGVTEYLLSLSPSGTFTGPVLLSVTGLPDGATAIFAPPALTAPGRGALAIAVPATAVAGTYTLTLTGTAGALVRTATVTLIVA